MFTGCSQGPGTGLEVLQLYNHLFQSLRQAFAKTLLPLAPFVGEEMEVLRGPVASVQGHTEWASGRAALTQACVANHPPSCLPTELLMGEFFGLCSD